MNAGRFVTALLSGLVYGATLLFVDLDLNCQGRLRRPDPNLWAWLLGSILGLAAFAVAVVHLVRNA